MFHLDITDRVEAPDAAREGYVWDLWLHCDGSRSATERHASFPMPCDSAGGPERRGVAPTREEADAWVAEAEVRS